MKTTHQLVAEGPAQNVRVGRRFYPTFDARMPLMGWLLDHFFVSPQFRVAALKWPPAVGSDSFPLLVGLVSSRE